MILGIVKEPEVGETFDGEVVGIKDFGAFVKLTPGKDGLLHISRVANGRVGKVEDVLNLGDIIKVEVLEDPTGKIADRPDRPDAPESSASNGERRARGDRKRRPRQSSGSQRTRATRRQPHAALPSRRVSGLIRAKGPNAAPSSLREDGWPTNRAGRVTAAQAAYIRVVGCSGT